ncbi:hypothetical protein IMG5_014780 [Ichthyophthirius multifiliis]|uniref:Uncharacterized protein n=1 Tax=Ichthyophthirius multifiliis TaxID=5932 RepID=G0QK96_ICHMU|nr:hypothetical protein IMG5_014780 [Ichthyophthirius multifiliis]EGR34356.1 hypothetical protein IMG5_014780 [Ichthyophthirius multifiliis]|eukprot:XP_004039660.1 hypothetical protein IMG5_014780 [Ichthyophthirius multifiliis]
MDNLNVQQERAEQALEYYKSAAVKFKLAKSWDDAAEAYIRCAKCEQAGDGGNAGEYYVEAANMKKKNNTSEAIKYFEEAIQFFCKENRFGYAAKLKKQIAEIFEQDLETDLAIKAYEESADLFFAENDQSSDYYNSKIKVADLMTSKTDQQVNYIEAIKIYEQVGYKYCENKLLQGTAKNIFFKAALLYLCNDDSVGCGIALEKFMDSCPPFNNTRQSKFLQELIKCFDEKNMEDFSTQCYEFNQIIPLDKWQVSVLNKIKEKMKSGEQVGVEGDGGIL